jgi:nitroreductase
MDALEAIQTRRSVRRYTNQKITDEIVQQLLTAAMSAPSAANEQPWEFVVIQDRKMLDEIPAFSTFGRWRSALPSAYSFAPTRATLSFQDSGFKIARRLHKICLSQRTRLG